MRRAGPTFAAALLLAPDRAATTILEAIGRGFDLRLAPATPWWPEIRPMIEWACRVSLGTLDRG